MANALIIPETLDDAKFGPAMRRLNERQQKFVLAMTVYGCGNNATRAAEAAGYCPGGTRESISATAARLTHDAKIKEAIIETARANLSMATIGAVGYLTDLVFDVTAASKDRAMAAKTILDRGGVHALSELKITVSDEESRAEKIRQLIAFANQTGRNPRELLGSLADVTDADYKVLNDGEGAVAELEGFI